MTDLRQNTIDSDTVFAPRDQARAVLFDFGGVLTASVLKSFGDVSEEVSGDRNLVFSLLTEDEEAMAALVEHECGRSSDEEFEAALAGALVRAGATVDAEGLIARLQRNLHPDRAMIELVARLRSAGVPVGLVSNSLGRNCYAGFDLDSMFDAQAISGLEGVRKPSRALYEVACLRLGVAPTEAVMIDDLAANITAATDFGMGGIVHTDASTTAAALVALLDLDPAVIADLSTVSN